jgi:2-hydroxychromene-2-carboxylate isomerase
VTRSFAITFDYRCPYARIAHEHVITGLRAGADWDVTFLPFSLGQAHVEDGGTPVWEQPDVDSGLLALQLGLAVRDAQPEQFLDAHRAIFDHRHVAAGDLRDREALTAALAATGVDVEAAWAVVDSGAALAVAEKEHTQYVESHRVFGVPTFIVGERAVFIRLLEIPGDDSALAVATIDHVLDLLDWRLLNEFKHTSIPR